MTTTLDLGVPAAATATRCDGCGSDVAAGLLTCPGCQRLVHAVTPNELKTQAETAARAGDYAAELAAWRSAVALFPVGSRQHTRV